MSACLVGVVLAGGRATRYGGIAKGMLARPEGGTIVEGLLCALDAAGVVEVIVMANEAEPYLNLGCRIVPDRRAGMGPLGGIEAALAAIDEKTEGVMIVPCDLPGLGARETVALRRAYEGAAAGVVYAVTADGGEHPACVVLHRRHAASVGAALDRGERRLSAVWGALDAEKVRFDDAAPFFNVNSPEEMARWVAGRDVSC